MKNTSAVGCSHSQFLDAFDKRWLSVSLAAAGAVAATDAADAGIVYFNPAGGITVPVSGAGVYINLETGANGTTQAAANGGQAATAPLVNFWGTTAFRAYFYPNPTSENRYVVDGGNNLAALAPNTLIGTGSTFAAGRNLFTTSPANTTWNSTGGFEGLLGYKFRNNANTQTLFGWMRVRINPWTGGSLYAGGTVLEWAFEDTGAAIPAGAVPEPTGLAALALGAVGLVMRRRSA